MGPQAFSYDGVTGDFNGIVSCQPCKVEIGKFLLPAKATWVVPPEGIDGKRRVWNGVKWEYKDIPRVPDVVDKALVEKAEETRENPELVTLLVENMRMGLEQRVMKAAGARLDAVQDAIERFDVATKKMDLFRSDVAAKLEDFNTRLDSLTVELGALLEKSNHLMSAKAMLQDKIVQIEMTLNPSGEAPAETSGAAAEIKTVETPKVAAVEEKKSRFKFWS